MLGIQCPSCLELIFALLNTKDCNMSRAFFCLSAILVAMESKAT